MTPTKKPHPVKGGARVLTTSRGHGTLGARTQSADTILADPFGYSNKYQIGTDSRPPVIALRGRLGYGRVTSALPKKAIRLAVYRCIPSDPLDAGVSQNRSSGHEGEGPPARKAKGYGQRRWVGQHRSSRIGVPKASNDGVRL